MRLVASCFAVALVGVAAARADVTAPKPAPLIGVTQEARVVPDKGFVDDPVAFDGGRLAYIATDGATFADLVLYDVVAKADKLRVAMPTDLGTPTTLRFGGSGENEHVLAIGRGDDGVARAALIGVDGKVLRRFGPASDINLVVRVGTPRVAIHRQKGIGKGGTRHEVELVDLDKGKRVGKLRSVDLDGAATVAKLDFHVNHWDAGYTHAIGIKGGHWDPKENQRTPDVFADYDLVDGTFKTAPIDDVVGNARRLLVLAARGASDDPVFAHLADDHSGVELWKDGKATTLDLDQPLAQYDTGTLASFVDEKGAAWIALKVDPVNSEAVKHQKADAEYLDLFSLDDAGARAHRRARVLVTPKKQYRWGIAAGRWWLLERSVGFDRGGTVLTVYTLGG